MTTSFNANTIIAAGTILEGKWNHRKYKVERLLGKGANGAVYLVSGKEAERSALKIGYDAVDIQSEINILTSLSAQQNTIESRMPTGASRPFLLDVDDWSIDGREVPFYVMKYVEGINLSQYIERNGSDWMGMIGLRLLKKLSELHAMGWVFGDIKPDNILVSDYGQVELVDYGGVTNVGRGVKQFTEWYDRGFWNAGSRIADAGYDYFAFTVLWIHIMDGERLRKQWSDQLPQSRNVTDLIQLVRTHSRLKTYESWLVKSLQGKWALPDEAYTSWQQIVLYHGSRARHSTDRMNQTPRWLKTTFAGAVILLLTTVILMFIQM